jgi:hypothetical protein
MIRLTPQLIWLAFLLVTTAPAWAQAQFAGSWQSSTGAVIEIPYAVSKSTFPLSVTPTHGKPFTIRAHWSPGMIGEEFYWVSGGETIYARADFRDPDQIGLLGNHGFNASWNRIYEGCSR